MTKKMLILLLLPTYIFSDGGSSSVNGLWGLMSYLFASREETASSHHIMEEVAQNNAIEFKSNADAILWILTKYETIRDEYHGPHVNFTNNNNVKELRLWLLGGPARLGRRNRPYLYDLNNRKEELKEYLDEQFGIHEGVDIEDVIKRAFDELDDLLDATYGQLNPARQLKDLALKASLIEAKQAMYKEEAVD